MIEISISAKDATSLRDELLSRAVESCAVLLASQVHRRDGLTRLLVRELAIAEEGDYLVREPLQSILSPAFVARVAKIAVRADLSLIFVHSHPGAEPPHFSALDDEGERTLSAFLGMRLPGRLCAAIVLSKGGWACRALSSAEPCSLIALGDERTTLAESGIRKNVHSEVFDRQIRAFGAAGQATIALLRVAIVGLGGTGSIIAQQLAHLGVRNFLLIDPDRIEPSNLNRIVGATPDDVGCPKVEVAYKNILNIAPSARCELLESDVVRTAVAHNLTDVDVIFGCTDSHGSRAVLQQVAYQYLIPCFDVGSTITVSGGLIDGIFGRVQLLAPGRACFSCCGVLDSNEVRRDMMSPFERRSDPYIQGAREPAPAVISLNGTVVSLCITMFLSFAAGVPSTARSLIYNAKVSTLRSVHAEPDPECFICSLRGVFARGDGQKLFARQD